MQQTGIYLRVSHGEQMGEDESNSIMNQRTIILKFISQRNEFSHYKTYIDDGWSGSDFEHRPGFCALLEDVRKGNIQCVIVKDLSRFGRDYIKVGKILQRVFPAFSIRFISIMDHYDSAEADLVRDGILLPLYNYFNEFYCRDISQKIRSQQKVKRLQGKYTAAFPVYGYRKSEKNKYNLVPDQSTAPVVRRIFQEILEGYTTSTIAKRLNKEEVPSPLEIKRKNNSNYYTGFCKESTSRWSSVGVKRILTNPVYTGDMVQGRRERINYKSKKTADVPKERWDVVSNTHMPLVSRKEFNIVQELILLDGKPAKDRETVDLLCGIIRCHCCKSAMVRKKRKRQDDIFVCRGCMGKPCCEKNRIQEGELLCEISKCCDIGLEEISRKIIVTKIKRIIVFNDKEIFVERRI